MLNGINAIYLTSIILVLNIFDLDIYTLQVRCVVLCFTQGVSVMLMWIKI
jgi:hypothetical protein